LKALWKSGLQGRVEDQGEMRALAPEVADKAPEQFFPEVDR
jgi:hypothetical protein